MQNNLVKSYKEIKNIKKASDIIDDIYDLILQTIKAGVSEIQVADFIRNCVKEKGGEDVSFDTIVAFGESGAEPHHVPTEKLLEKGMLVTIDMGAIVNGYCSDFTRTFAFGEINDEQKAIYETVYQAQKLALDAVVDDVDCLYVDKIARSYISEKGYGEFYVHGTGHGVGKEIHENPYLNARTTEILKNNMVVTIEPGIYIPKKMGVRIEDMIVVGEKNAVSRHGTELLVIK